MRVLDTRKGTGTGKVAKIPANGTITVQIAGLENGSLPASSQAVALNLTAVGATRNGVLSVYPANLNGVVPITSNVNYVVGRNLANMAIVTPGAEGDLGVYPGGTGTAQLILDESGYFANQ